MSIVLLLLDYFGIVLASLFEGFSFSYPPPFLDRPIRLSSQSPSRIPWDFIPAVAIPFWISLILLFFFSSPGNLKYPVLLVCCFKFVYILISFPLWCRCNTDTHDGSLTHFPLDSVTSSSLYFTNLTVSQLAPSTLKPLLHLVANRLKCLFKTVLEFATFFGVSLQAGSCSLPLHLGNCSFTLSLNLHQTFFFCIVIFAFIFCSSHTILREFQVQPSDSSHTSCLGFSLPCCRSPGACAPVRVFHYDPGYWRLLNFSLLHILFAAVFMSLI